MAGFPSQKAKMETFVYYLYEGKKGKKLSKQETLSRVSGFKFAPDEEVFFKELPEGSYDEDSLIQALNRVIQSRGRAHAIGGMLEKRTQIPQEWQTAYHQMLRAEMAEKRRAA